MRNQTSAYVSIASAPFLGAVQKWGEVTLETAEKSYNVLLVLVFCIFFSIFNDFEHSLIFDVHAL